jgi:uncharacterized protein (DUF1015 family)
MPRVAPFRGLRYDEAVAGPLAALTAPPYDVISAPRRDGYLAASPYNVVHLDLAEGDADAAVPGNRYERAAATLETWRRAGALSLDDRPRYYAYELTWPAADQPAGSIRGIFCALTLEPWGGAVVPHEHTMPGPVADRLELLRATRLHLSAIYGTVPGPIEPLADALEAVTATDPIETQLDEEGVRHRLWALPGDLPIDRWLAGEELLIADGHHRYTTALAYRDERHAAHGPGPWDTILAFVADAGTQEVPVLPYHRVQLSGDLPRPDRAVDDLAEVAAGVDDGAGVVGTIVRDGDGLAYGLLDLGGDPPVVRTLHHEVLDRHAPGDALRFTHSAADAAAAVRAGDAIAAYILPPTTPERVRTAIHHGDRLPRKSTFFWPKPRTGMVFMPVDRPADLPR